MPLDQDAFRAVLGRFASGVTIVTVRGANGRDYGMTVSAFSSVSLEPPLVMVCIGEEASLKPMIAEASHYGVSILASAQEPLSRRFAAHGADDRSQIILHRHRAVGKLAVRLGAGRQVLHALHVDAGVVLDGDVRVFEFVSGEDADDAVARGDHLLGHQLP